MEGIGKGRTARGNRRCQRCRRQGRGERHHARRCQATESSGNTHLEGKPNDAKRKTEKRKASEGHGFVLQSSTKKLNGPCIVSGFVTTAKRQSLGVVGRNQGESAEEFIRLQKASTKNLTKPAAKKEKAQKGGNLAKGTKKGREGGSGKKKRDRPARVELAIKDRVNPLSHSGIGSRGGGERKKKKQIGWGGWNAAQMEKKKSKRPRQRVVQKKKA